MKYFVGLSCLASGLLVVASSWKSQGFNVRSLNAHSQASPHGGGSLIYVRSAKGDGLSRSLYRRAPSGKGRPSKNPGAAPSEFGTPSSPSSPSSFSSQPGRTSKPKDASQESQTSPGGKSDMPQKSMALKAETINQDLGARLTAHLGRKSPPLMLEQAAQQASSSSGQGGSLRSQPQPKPPAVKDDTRTARGKASAGSVSDPTDKPSNSQNNRGIRRAEKQAQAKASKSASKSARISTNTTRGQLEAIIASARARESRNTDADKAMEAMAASVGGYVLEKDSNSKYTTILKPMPNASPEEVTRLEGQFKEMAAAHSHSGVTFKDMEHRPNERYHIVEALPHGSSAAQPQTGDGRAGASANQPASQRQSQSGAAGGVSNSGSAGVGASGGPSSSSSKIRR